MSAIQLKREHFTNGRNFSKEDFERYLQASSDYQKSLYTRYLPSLAGGILVSFLFSRGVGGAVGNLMAVACIFAGLILGGVLSKPYITAAREIVAKLGITGKDAAAARKHAKEGTVAWSDAPEADGGERTELQTTAPEVSATATEQAATEPKEWTPERKPSRALWAAGGFALLWILPLLIQRVFSPRTSFCADALYFCSLAVVAAGLYFICLPGVKRKLTGGALSIAGAVLIAFSTAVARNIKAYAYHIELGKLLSLRNLIVVSSLKSALLCVVFAVAAALLTGYLMRNRPFKKRYSAAGGVAAATYFLINSFLTLRMYWFQLGAYNARHYASIFSALILDALCLYLVFLALGALGAMEHSRVRLQKIGLVWAWIALCAMSVALIVSIAAGNELAGPGSYTTQYVLLAAGIAGYAMLLCRRRIGLYVILLGTGLLLGAQTLSILSGVFYGADGYGALLASSILGGLNPLFAYLAVRAGKNIPDPAAAKRIEDTVLEQ